MPGHSPPHVAILSSLFCEGLIIEILPLNSGNNIRITLLITSTASAKMYNSSFLQVNEILDTAQP
jgi:hypothetical protein